MNLFSPNIAHASLDTFLTKLNSQIVNPLIQLLFAVAIIYFLYGVFKMIMNPDNEEVRTEARSHMIWGVIGLVIMMGVWGILNVILATLHIEKSEIDPENNKVQLKEYNPPPFNKIGN